MQTVIRYPWERWFSKKKTTLVHGKDFKCLPHSMAVQIRQAAIRYGYDVSVYLEVKTIQLVVHGRARPRQSPKTKKGKQVYA